MEKFKAISCEEEYAKDPNIKREDIQELANWVQGMSYMPKVSELLLIQTYHVCDYDLEKAKQLNELLYTFKTNAMELFIEEDYQSGEADCSFWDVSYSALLPKTTPEGYRIHYSGLKDFDSSKSDFQTTIRMGSRVMTTIICEQGTCPGYYYIFDAKGYNLGHLLSMRVPLLRKLVYFLQDAVPMKIKAIHVINVHSIFDKMLMLMKPFFKKRAHQLLYLHSSMDDFFKMVDKDYIPKDLGGNLPQTREELTQETKAKVIALEDMVTEILQMKAEEKPSDDSEKRYFFDIRNWF